MERITSKSWSGVVYYVDAKHNLALEPCEMNAHQVRLTIEKLEKYENTGMTPDEINTLREIDNLIKTKFNGALNLRELVDGFCKFYDANSDGERVAEAILITNEEVAKWKELRERDTAKAIVVDDMTGGIKLYSCPICDMPVHEKDNFCPECGQRLKLATETQRPEWKNRMMHTFLGGHHD